MRPMVVGESFKNYSKGSSRMAGKGTHGKTNQKRNQAQNWSYWGRGWCGAGPLDTLFPFTSAAAHRHHLG